jgi:peptidoglycan/xylan/chitin deacetylase (PgdA/CDA1 family)
MFIRRNDRNFKSFILHALTWTAVDRFFRYLNNDKLLVVMYHGVTENQYDPPVWTQLPHGIFRGQLEYLDRHYHIITLADLTAAILGKKSLPQKPALITFDDGLKNNFSVAFPILREMGLPATIFLTIDFIGTRNLLWFDELYLLMKEAMDRGIRLPLPNGMIQEGHTAGEISGSCLDYIETLKHAGNEYRLQVMEKLHASFPFDREKWLADFGLLDWSNVLEMHQSGLIDFGVHTASHCVLSELPRNDWEREIVAPKKKLESFLGSEISSFCFPNGRPEIDFRPEHMEYLRGAGYQYAFSTENSLFSFSSSEPMNIGRIPAGNDWTSEPAYFRLNTSGAIQFLAWVLNRRRRAA